MSKRIPAIIFKEVHHILRDPRTLMIVILMPILQLVIFGYAMNMELKSIRLGIYNQNRSAVSRAFIESFYATDNFAPILMQENPENLNTRFFERRLHAAIIIPSYFDTDLENNKLTTLQLIVDASDPNAATMIKNYCLAVVNMQNLAGLSEPMKIQTSILYNPDQKSAYFFVPGLIAMILVMISALLTSIAITKEKELGTMEQILVSPISAHEIVIGKVLPYIAIAFVDALLILGLGMTVFGVPFYGSFGVFIVFTLLYVLMALSLGLMISTVAKSQQAAMMFAITITMLPTMMLSGFIFPIASMPKLLQLVTWLVPAKYYLQIIRGIMLKDNTFSQLIQPALILLLMTLVLLTIAIRRFKLRLQ